MLRVHKHRIIMHRIGILRDLRRRNIILFPRHIWVHQQTQLMLTLIMGLLIVRLVQLFLPHRLNYKKIYLGILRSIQNVILYCSGRFLLFNFRLKVLGLLLLSELLHFLQEPLLVIGKLLSIVH